MRRSEGYSPLTTGMYAVLDLFGQVLKGRNAICTSSHESAAGGSHIPRCRFHEERRTESIYDLRCPQCGSDGGTLASANLDGRHNADPPIGIILRGIISGRGRRVADFRNFVAQYAGGASATGATDGTRVPGEARHRRHPGYSCITDSQAIGRPSHESLWSRKRN